MRRASVMPQPRRRRPRLDYPLYRLVADIKLQRRCLAHQRDEGRRWRLGGGGSFDGLRPSPTRYTHAHRCQAIRIQLNNTGFTENITHILELLRDDGFYSLAASAD